MLFGLALLIYLTTRLVDLTRFPIYFFADEAVQTLYAQDLINHHFRDTVNKITLPIYIEADGLRWTPLLPMYFHALTVTLFGKSVFVTRATSALVSLLAAISVAMILKQIFKARYWWAGTFLVAITPAWFLHSRTAFETVMTTAFYGCFLWFYLLYRCKSPRYIYAAIVFGAATFYTYSNAQVIMATVTVLLFLSDIRYHRNVLRHHWRIVLLALLVLLIVALPLIVFESKRPSALRTHLRIVDSYWFHAIPLKDKITTFIHKFTYGLSPAYWLFPNVQDLPRHRMDSISHILTVMLPFMLIGVIVCLCRGFVRLSPPHRAIIMAALATPVGASLVDIGITRVLAFIIPANIIIGLGLDTFTKWVKQLFDLWKKRIPEWAMQLAIFFVLAVGSFAMLRTAIVQSSLWFSDYGLYGMQYGAVQLFEEAIPQYLRQDPNIQVVVTSTWANGTDRFLRFFFSAAQQKQVRMGGIDTYLYRKTPIPPNEIFVMTPSEYERARTSPKFKSVEVDRILDYPDGRPGFYFTRMTYAYNADEIFAAEKEARKQLQEGIVEIDGQQVNIRYSIIDMGAPPSMFDGDYYTLMRGMEANPYIMEFTFPSPRRMSGVSIDVGAIDTTLTAKLSIGDSDQPITYTQTYRNVVGMQKLNMAFDQGLHIVTKIRLEVLAVTAGETANVHIRELKFLP